MGTNVPGSKREAARTDQAAPSPNATSGVSPRLSEAATDTPEQGAALQECGAGRGFPAHPDPGYRSRRVVDPRRPAPPPRRGTPGPAGKPGGKFACHSGAAREAPGSRKPTAAPMRSTGRASNASPARCSRVANNEPSRAGRERPSERASERATGGGGAIASRLLAARGHIHTPSPAAARASASSASPLPAAVPRPRTPRRPARPAHRLLPQPGAPLAAAGARLEDQPPVPPHNMASLGFRNGAREIQQGPLNIHERLGGGGVSSAGAAGGGREGASEEAEARDADVHRAGRPPA